MCGAVASCRSGSSCRLELVRRGCADRNPSRAPPRRFGFALELRRIGRALASLRRRAPPATAFQPRPGAAPCDGVSASLWSCASATAYRHRSGAASPATAFRPRPGGHDLCLGAALRCRAPPLRRRFGLALEPPPLRRRPGLALELCLRDGVSASLRCRVPSDSVSTPPWGPRPLPSAVLRRCTPPLGTTTLALGGHNPRRGHDPRSGVAPPVLGGFPAAMPRPAPPWGP